MPRLLLAALIVFAGVVLIGLALTRLARLLRREPDSAAAVSPRAKRFGHGYLFLCWLVCSAVLTALLWELWFP